MDKQLVEKSQKILDNKKVQIINNPKSLKNKFKKKKKVTVVVTTFNSESFIQKCLDSVVNQTFSFWQIELIAVDDHSLDDTPKILKETAEEHSNMTVVLLDENTGTAAMPRNIGIELATTDKIMFLDADDWLDRNALSELTNVMNEENDDFVVGKTVKVTDNGQGVHAEFISFKERKHLSPFEVPYMLYHMGPPSKLIKTSIIKENNIRFPEMKFGEDKFFLLRVLWHSSKVSTITSPIYYVNRLSSNNSSLTRTTEMLDKRSADMKIIKYVLNSELPINQEKTIMKRLIEYDLIKSCDSFIFVNSKDKQPFIDLIKEAFYLVSSRPYDIVETFDTPLYVAAARLIENGEEQDFINLFKWFKTDKNKHFIIKEGIAYYNVIPFNEDHQFKLIPIPLLARSKDAYVENNQYVQTFEIYGDQLENVSHVLVRDRKKIDNELEIPVNIDGNIGEFRVDYDKLNTLDNSLFSIFIRYDGHHLINIKRILESHVTFKKRDFTFYTTKAGNLGFSLKGSK